MSDKEFVKKKFPKAVLVKIQNGKIVYGYDVRGDKDSNVTIAFGTTKEYAWRGAKNFIELNYGI